LEVNIALIPSEARPCVVTFAPLNKKIQIVHRHKSRLEDPSAHTGRRFRRSAALQAFCCIIPVSHRCSVRLSFTAAKLGALYRETASKRQFHRTYLLMSLDRAQEG
jgi:hypothetical protein